MTGMLGAVISIARENLHCCSQQYRHQRSSTLVSSRYTEQRYGSLLLLLGNSVAYTKE